MARFAAGLSGSRLHPLVLMSDPVRTPDLLTLVRALPSRSAIIYRHFGRPGLERRLRSLTEQRDIQLLIGNDPQLAHQCGADGVHFSRRTAADIVARWRQARPGWIISQAAAKTKPDTPALAGLDAIFVSSIFPSNSVSSGTPIGVEALVERIKQGDAPIFALGGINARTVNALHGVNIAGIAAIDGLANELRYLIEKSEIMSEPITAKPNSDIEITREDQGDMIVFTAHLPDSEHVGELTLKKVSDRVWNANHTGVPSQIGGRGVGTALVKAMVDDARDTGYQIIPGCPFIAKLFERKPDWAKGLTA